MFPSELGSIAREMLGEGRVEDGRWSYYPNENYHSHSWLTAGEYAAVLAKAKLIGIKPGPTWVAAKAAMTTLTDAGYEVRCIFVSDN